MDFKGIVKTVKESQGDILDIMMRAEISALKAPWRETRVYVDRDGNFDYIIVPQGDNNWIDGTWVLYTASYRYSYDITSAYRGCDGQGDIDYQSFVDDYRDDIVAGHLQALQDWLSAADRIAADI